MRILPGDLEARTLIKQAQVQGDPCAIDGVVDGSNGMVRAPNASAGRAEAECLFAAQPDPAS
jgi:hypothetical protein